MKRLDERFPIFSMAKKAEAELGRRLFRMGYERESDSKVPDFVLQKLWNALPKQLVLVSKVGHFGHQKQPL